MTVELDPIDIREIPELARLVDEVRTSRRPRRIVRDGEDLAVLRPARRQANPRRRRVLTKDDPLFDFVAIGRSAGPGDVSANKHHYLAEAIRTRTTRDPAR
jgi:hypothetical protein